MPLESSLHVLGARDPVDAVKTFLDVQKTYVDYYATLGDPDTLAQGRRAVDPERNALASPVLKPRAPLPDSSIQHSPTKNTSKKLKQSSKENKRAPNSTSHLPEIDDEEQERQNRLAERRERRREKRAILTDRPLAIEVTRGATERSSDGEAGKTTGRRSKKTQNRPKDAPSQKPKVPLGLALMESFAAKNVKKDRLTLKPPSSFGMFNKGKASIQTQKTTGTTNRNQLVFSESKFLGSRGRRETRASESSRSSDEDEPLHFDFIRAKTSTYFGKPEAPKPIEAPVSQKQKKKKAIETASIPKEKRMTPSRRSAASEVWDIEVDEPLPDDASSIASEPPSRAPEPDKSIASKLPSSTPHSSLSREPTTRPLSPELMPVCRESDHSPATVNTLRPSHSASQVFQGSPTDKKSSAVPRAKCKDDPTPATSMVPCRPFPIESLSFHRRSPSLTELEMSLPLIKVSDRSHPRLSLVQTIPREPSLVFSDDLVSGYSIRQPSYEALQGDRMDLDAEADIVIDDALDYTLESEGQYAAFSYIAQPRRTGTEVLDEFDMPLSNSNFYVEFEGEDDQDFKVFEGGEIELMDHCFHEEDYAADGFSAGSADDYAYEQTQSELDQFSAVYPCDIQEDIDDPSGGGEDFAEGRALLYRLRSPGTRQPSLSFTPQAQPLLPSDMIEREVAAKLKNHWRPLKF